MCFLRVVVSVFLQTFYVSAMGIFFVNINCHWLAPADSNHQRGYMDNYPTLSESQAGGVPVALRVRTRLIARVGANASGGAGAGALRAQWAVVGNPLLCGCSTAKDLQMKSLQTARNGHMYSTWWSPLSWPSSSALLCS